jgi:hypothetical protein
VTFFPFNSSCLLWPSSAPPLALLIIYGTKVEPVDLVLKDVD